MRSAIAGVILSLSLFLSLPLAAQFQFQAVNVPGALETQVRGINNKGTIVGFYRLPTDACIEFGNGGVEIPSCDSHGFRIAHGVLTKLDVPGSLSTTILGVNDAGDLVGYYTKTSEACIIEQHGFLWDHHNVIRSFDYSDETGFCGTDALYTVPYAISNAGAVAGAIGSPLDGVPNGAFLYQHGTFTSVNPTGLEGGCFTCASVFGISSNGTMVGTAYRVLEQIPEWVAFMKRGAEEDFFTRTQDDTWATGINDQGNIVGYGVYGAGFLLQRLDRGKAHGVVAEPMAELTPVGYPGAVGTYPFAINNQRTVVGAYMAVDGTMHGFVAAAKR